MTTIPFNFDEALAMAEQIERNGAKFYRKAAESPKLQTLKKLFLDLAAMEDNHLKTFSGMRAGLSEREKEPTAFDPENQAVLYLRAMADGYIFDAKKDPVQFVTDKETAASILKFAIGIEKDSVVFYTGLKDAVPPKLGKDKMDWIIKEEMKHIGLLSSQLAALGSK